MNHRAKYLLWLQRCSWPLAACTSASLAYDGWSVLAALPASNSETGVAALDGKIFVVGGYPSDRKTVATVQMYDSATDKWQIVAPLPVPLNHVMAAGVNGKVYVIGGQTTESSEPAKRASSTRSMNMIRPLIAGRCAHPCRPGAAAARQRWPTGKFTSRAAVRRAAPISRCTIRRADRWTTLPNLPTQRNHLAADAIDGKIYVIGGRFEGGFQESAERCRRGFRPQNQPVVETPFDAKAARRREWHRRQWLLSPVRRRRKSGASLRHLRRSRLLQSRDRHAGIGWKICPSRCTVFPAWHLSRA